MTKQTAVDFADWVTMLPMVEKKKLIRRFKHHPLKDGEVITFTEFLFDHFISNVYER